MRNLIELFKKGLYPDSLCFTFEVLDGDKAGSYRFTILPPDKKSGWRVDIDFSPGVVGKGQYSRKRFRSKEELEEKLKYVFLLKIPSFFTAHERMEIIKSKNKINKGENK